MPTLIQKISSGVFETPNTHPEIRDLISRMIAVDPEKRLSVEGIKEHLAFSMYLPDDYILPAPLPLLHYYNPIDVSSIQPNVLSVLQDIGYSSRDELIHDLETGGQYMAKIFYFMLIRLIDYTALPWHQASCSTCLFDDPDESPAGGISKYESLNSGILLDSNTCFSLAQKQDWTVGDLLPTSSIKEVIMKIENYYLTDIMYALQVHLLENEYSFFFIDDETLIAMKDQKIYVTIKAETLEFFNFNLHVTLQVGQEEDFQELENCLNELIETTFPPP